MKKCCVCSIICSSKVGLRTNEKLLREYQRELNVIKLHYDKITFWLKTKARIDRLHVDRPNNALYWDPKDRSLDAGTDDAYFCDELHAVIDATNAREQDRDWTSTV